MTDVIRVLADDDPLSLVVVTLAMILALLTFRDFVRDRGGSAWEIPLFFALSGGGLFLLNQTATPELFTVGALLFVATPYLLLRLVQQFRPVPRPVAQASFQHVHPDTCSPGGSQRSASCRKRNGP